MYLDLLRLQHTGVGKNVLLRWVYHGVFPLPFDILFGDAGQSALDQAF